MLAAARSLRLHGRSVVMTMLTHQAAAKVTSQNRPPAKTASRQNDPWEKLTAPVCLPVTLPHLTTAHVIHIWLLGKQARK